MLFFPLWKRVLVIGICVAGLAFAMPNLFYDSADTANRAGDEITRLERIYLRNLEHAGVTPFHQHAVVASPHSVRLADGREVTTKHILIATGGAPFVPGFQGSHLANDEQGKAVNELVIGGKVDPCLSRTFAFDDLATAHQLMHDNKHPPGQMAILVNATEEGQGAS